MSERWQRLQELFFAAVNLPSGERPAWLDRMCGGDATLRAELERMLAADGEEASPVEATRQVGDLPGRLGAYPVEGVLGSGGMGRVYAARDLRLERPVAIKVLAEAAAADPAGRSRFEEEARALAALHHPHIAAVYSLEEEQGELLLVMERVEGLPLSEVLSGGPLSVERTLRIGRDIAAALAAAHARGVVHRDMKPSNVMIEPSGSAKVLDFGLARRVAEAVGSPGAASAGAAPGAWISPGYSSPERLRGQEEDARGDLWGLGCILYECLAGRPAFPGETPADRIAAVLRRRPDWSALPPDAPPSAVAVLASCLAKNLAQRPLDAFAVERALERTDRPQARAAEGTTHNLPAPITRFVGRERELRFAGGFLARGRLLSVVGPGGSGKTRLSLELAHRHRDEFRDGAWFADLSTTAEAALLHPAIVGALGLREDARRSPRQILESRFRDARALLILDNCEHLVEACAELAWDLLQACPGLQILATSRQPLGVTGEAVLRLPPLPLPDPGSSPPAAELAEIEAVQLFVDRTVANRPDFQLSEANGGVVSAICRRLDGIPLALELAAARARSLTMEEIAAGLDDRFRLLSEGSRVSPARHRTLRASIEWSYELLEAEDQRAIRRLSVAAGFWTLDVAEALCAEDPARPGLTVDRVYRLVEKSLVEMEAAPAAKAAPTRYRMLETVRSFALERLGRHGEEPEARRRLVAHVLQLAEEADRHLRGPEQLAWIERLRLEGDSERSALEFALSPTMDPVLGMRLAAALGRFWLMVGRCSEGRRFCAAMLAREDRGASPAVRAQALNWAGNLASWQADYPQARRYYEESYELRRSLGDSAGVSASLNNLGVVFKRLGDLERAEDYFREALRLQRSHGDSWAVAVALGNLGTVLEHAGKAEEARELHEEGLAISRGHEDVHGIVQALVNLGNVHIRLREFSAAHAALEECARLQESMGNQHARSEACRAAGTLARERGEFARAAALYAECLRLHGETGDQLGVVETCEACAVLAASVGKNTLAARLLAAAQGMRGRLRAPVWPADQGRVDRMISALRDSVADSGLRPAWEQGRTDDQETTLRIARQFCEGVDGC